MCPQSLDLRFEPVTFLTEELYLGQQREEVGLARASESKVVAADDGGANGAKVQVAFMLCGHAGTVPTTHG